MVLQAKEKITSEQLMQIASYINKVHRWKFSYGRMVNKERVKNLDIVFYEKILLKKTLKELLPKTTQKENNYECHKFSTFNITELFDLERGDFHALDRLSSGKYPTVSRVAYDNGIVGFFDKPKNANIYPSGTITIATTTGDAFVQLDDFIATDNVVILIPKIKFTLEELFFIAAMINREKWRVSYGRQCYKTTFAKTNIYLPTQENRVLDSKYMQNVVSNSYNFDMIKSYTR